MKKWILFLLWVNIMACNTSTGEMNSKEENSQPQRTVEEIVDYYPNGLKKVEGKLINGEKHGHWIFYYDNGFMWSEGMFKYGIREGFSVVYYKDGRKRMKGQYENDQKVGPWTFWNDQGEFVETINADELRARVDSLSASES